MSLAFVAPVATHIFGVSYAAGDPVDVSEWSARAVQQALSRGWITVAPSGGSTPGAPVVRKFPFAFDSADILTGHAVYTPTIGDILLDAWVEITTAWDGTTPLADIGTFVGGQSGVLRGSTQQFISMSNADSEYAGVTGWLQNSDPTVMSLSANIELDNLPGAARVFPLKFTTVDPVKVCVSQDGTNIGDDPGSTRGAAILYLVTATPA